MKDLHTSWVPATFRLFSIGDENHFNVLCQTEFAAKFCSKDGNLKSPQDSNGTVSASDSVNKGRKRGVLGRPPNYI